MEQNKLKAHEPFSVFILTVAIVTIQNRMGVQTQRGQNTRMLLVHEHELLCGWGERADSTGRSPSQEVDSAGCLRVTYVSPFIYATETF